MSRPNRVRILLVLAFVLTLVAGVVAGIGFATARGGTGGNVAQVPQPGNGLVKPTTGSAPPERNWVADQLGLTPEQRTQFLAIWKETPHDKIRALDNRRRALFGEQWDKIAALYTSEQRSERERVSKEYEARFAELKRERDEAMAGIYTPEQTAERERLTKEYAAHLAAVGKERELLLQPMIDKTRQVLTEEQRKRFDGMMRGPDRGGFRGGPPGGGNRSPGTQPSTTRPADWSQRPGGEWPGRPDGGRGSRGGGDRGGNDRDRDRDRDRGGPGERNGAASRPAS